MNLDEQQMKVIFEEVDLKKYKYTMKVFWIIWLTVTCVGFAVFMIFNVLAATAFVISIGIAGGYMVQCIDEKRDAWYKVYEDVTQGKAKILCFQDGHVHVEQEDKEVIKLSISELQIAERTDIDEIVINVKKLKFFVPYGKNIERLT